MGSVGGVRMCRGTVANDRRMIGVVRVLGWVEAQFVSIVSKRWVGNGQSSTISFQQTLKFGSRDSQQSILLS